MRKLLIALLLLIPLSALAVLGLPQVIDAQMNSVANPPPYAASASAQKLHQGLFVADLHDDALLWERDLLKRYDYGHSDLPRMLEGRLGLQVFSTVTKTPRGLNMESNGADSDNITLLAMAQRWPRETWNSLLQRALYQAQKLQDAAAGSDGRLVLIRTARTWRTSSKPGKRTRAASPACSPPRACNPSKASWKTSTCCMTQASVSPA